MNYAEMKWSVQTDYCDTGLTTEKKDSSVVKQLSVAVHACLCAPHLVCSWIVEET
jgi:hypothetical protein